jgi:hypothetical protein
MTEPPFDPDEAFRAETIPDAGFTERVLDGLPRPRRGRAPLLLAFATAAGGLGAILASGPAAGLAAALVAWASGTPLVAATVAAALAAGAAVVALPESR